LKKEKLLVNNWVCFCFFSGWKASLSPNEVSNIIAMAKQASANVLIAQQQVQAARDNVLSQQRMASEKEAQAQILTQKSEAAAAIQRSEGTIFYLHFFFKFYFDFGFISSCQCCSSSCFSPAPLGGGKECCFSISKGGL
jgi:hypothetical protein